MIKNNKKDLHIEAVHEILNPESNFIEDIEKLVKDENITYIDAILHWTSTKNIEMEQIIPLIKTNIKFKKKFAAQAKELNWLK
jgi:hypothetical protein